MARYGPYPRKYIEDPLLYELAEAAQMHPGVVFEHARKMLALIKQETPKQ